jgi:hypothetical protein
MVTLGLHARPPNLQQSTQGHAPNRAVPALALSEAVSICSLGQIVLAFDGSEDLQARQICTSVAQHQTLSIAPQVGGPDRLTVRSHLAGVGVPRNGFIVVRTCAALDVTDMGVQPTKDDAPYQPDYAGFPTDQRRIS